MPAPLLMRHGATDKNETEGMTDTPLTPVNANGMQQARDAGAGLCPRLMQAGISNIVIVASAHVRTRQTASLMMNELERRSHAAGRPIHIVDWIEDPRIGEIDILRGADGKKMRASAAEPGIFGFQVAGTTVAEIAAQHEQFRKEVLDPPRAPDTQLIVVGHRGSLQVLVESQFPHLLAHDNGRLWKMHNCEILRLGMRDVEILHPGQKALRDAEDPNRAAHRERKRQIAVAQAGIVAPVGGRTHSRAGNGKPGPAS